jgi:hypothetical protein
MAFVLRFEDYRPSPRDDGIKWVTARLEYSSLSVGPFTLFDSKVIANYPDALDPPELSFTTDDAPLTPAWYRVVFVDSLGGTQDTTPSYFKGGPAYRPSTRDVALHIKNRTIDASGNYVGDFTEDTVAVTGEEVAELILKAEEFVLRALDQDPDVAIPDESLTGVRSLIALFAAMLVELTKFSEQVARDASPYDKLKDLFDEQLEVVQVDLGVTPTAGTISGASMTAWYLVYQGQHGTPQYDFPVIPDVGWGTRF